MKPSAAPLRILIVLHLPWDARLGAARVLIELAREWTRAGHTVEKFCLTDAWPEPASSRAGAAFRQSRFSWRAAEYIRRNVDRFDVIDCLIGVLPFQKRSLRLRGLLVARSVGLHRLYDKFLRQSRILWPNQPKGRWFGRLFHRWLDWRAWREAERSVRACDLLNLPNEDERLALARDPAVRAPAIVLPYGLTEDFRAALARAAAQPAQRLARKTICFIGMWSPRKGAYDWPRIIAAIRQLHPTARFLLLGTMFEERAVRSDLGLVEGISCRTTFTEAELPGLLAECTVALFPSYIEGFGLAVLEQLAAGLPTVAYEVPGPRQILDSQRERLLTPVGDPIAMAARASEILALSVPEYEKLSGECRAIAQGYSWPEIARDTIDQYRAALESPGEEARGA
ncbi:MAG TPA: glycosyltransferase [Chthoniobacterales bacterium]|jgi:glycosyltransferase involved in cell wall biosynthesis|nr:glycosyltransferase [Chthoniobacterales bacterium]